MRNKLFTRVLLCLKGVFFILSAAFAQTKTITRTVPDHKGSVLPGAPVTVKSTKISTTTGADGKFSIPLPGGGGAAGGFYPGSFFYIHV
jgi:hypothetical protein